MKKLLPIIGASLFLGATACTDDDDVSTDTDGTEDAAGEEEASDSVDGGNMIFAMPSDAVTLDPQASTDLPSNIIADNVYESLLYYDENTEIQPRLAESYEQLDEHTWEFNLEENVTFHDGEPFNAYAVVATFDRLLDPEMASPRALLFELVEDVEAVGEYTVEITTSDPYAPLPAHMAHVSAGILSPAAIEADAEGEQSLDTNPVGTGPFEFESWEQGNEVVLNNNTDYWGDPANLDSLTFSVVPEQGTRIGMLENGEAHFVQQVEPANIPQVEAIDGAHLVSEEGFGFDYIGFNTENEPFDDPQVRRALSMALDKEVIVEGLYEGYGTVADGPLPDMTFGSSDNVDPLPYDPEQAQELLGEAGYGDGFSATLMTNDANPMRLQIAELVQDELSQLGVDVSIEQMEWGAYLDAVTEGEAGDMYILGWSAQTGDADFALQPNFHSDNIGPPGNHTRYENEEVDELLVEASQEMDEEARLQLYEEVEQILIDEAPMIYTLHTDYVVGISDSVEGFVQQPSGLFILENVTISEEAEGTGY
ncbi:peptide/nickel transport system substrate-binding protein [Geomicrobium halophilum]|uniref:Peptide/nickel transport system substrate-binding protein n=1 Tax=Geomicrobium halophilum TaxID=549000 RepID=A0A841PTG2_9BACL|nr:glutathione ABC transporter substrate-binding protein [Geomicrobium halophilum]MBB6451064.1 peptide/nickel transport system substrate-binding protein [Geomicrobium halophilum]